MAATKRARTIRIPGPLAASMESNAAAKGAWEKLAYTHKREYAEWITSAKKDETRERRVAQAVQMLAGGQKTPMRANDAAAVSGAPVGKKLLIKPGHRVAVMNAPDGYEARIVTGGAEAAAKKADVVVAFAEDTKTVARMAPKAIAAAADGGILWLAYPKKTSAIKTDISRDHGWEPFAKAGWEGCSLVAIDETWSAMRFRRS
jgi:hypothetical protein